MFGKNEIVGPAYFKKMEEGHLKVVSRFYTLQGEGPYSGRPAVFIRLAKCNLACHFCDTYFDSGSDYGPQELLEECLGLVEEANPDIDVKQEVGLVVTGGEPMLQKKYLNTFLEKCIPYFKWTQIETNGTISGDMPEQTTIVCSPKAPKAVREGMAARYIKPNKKWLERIDCLKFVVSADPKSEQHTIPEWALEWMKATGKDVYISPMNIYLNEPSKAKALRGTQKDITIEDRSTTDEVISFWEPDLLDLQANQANHQYAGELCMKYGCILNLQTHLYVSLA